MAKSRVRGLTFWQRGESRLVVPALGPCLEWIGACHPAGYGEFRENGKLVRAHVRSFELTHGPVPVGHMVRHRCDNPACFEPTHLVSGTHQQNVDDMVARGRNHIPSAGEKASFAKFSDAVIAQARALYGQRKSLVEISAETGISPSYLSRVVRGVSRG
jgi:hypothetical protein